MNFHLTDQRKKKINSVQSKPMRLSVYSLRNAQFKGVEGYF